MQLESGAHVYTASGEKLGHIDRVVLDPSSKAITHLVIRKGALLKTDKVLPIEWVAETNGDRVTLTPDAPSLDALPEFEEKSYIIADEEALVREPNGTVMAPGAAAAISNTLVPSLYWYPPAMSGLAAGSPAVYINPKPRLTKVVEENIPPNTVALKEGAKVIDADGHHVGNVERIYVNPDSKQATHLLLSAGLLLKKHKIVPVEWVDLVSDEEVCLAVGTKLLNGLPEYTA